MSFTRTTRRSTQSLLRPQFLQLRTFSARPPLRTESDTSASASSIATSFLTRFQSLGPQTRSQTLDANQLQLLSLTLNRPSLLPNSPPLSTTTLPSGTPLPAGYHLVYFTPAFLENDLGTDGTDTSYNPASPFTRRMWAGGEVHWPRRSDGKPNFLRVGQDVQETTRVLSAEPKVVRKTGEEMIVVGVEKEFSNGDGVAVLDRRNWVFRKALTSPSPTTSSNPPATKAFDGPATSVTSTTGNTHTRTLRQTAVTLFRFSALTFNPHKIHYSTPWARDVEGHKDIVVHGPLNLISILDLWRDTRGEGTELVLPERISYRATSPLYAEDEYRIVLDEEAGDGVARVQILAPGDVVAMKAEIQLKCCRTHPCSNCKKRGEASSCTFVGRGPRGKMTTSGRTSPAHVQDRLQHLENLILSLTQKKKLEGEGEGEGGVDFGEVVVVPQGKVVVPVQQRTPEDSGEGSVSVTEGASPSELGGKLLVGEAGTRYIDGAHWSAILEEISGVREYLQDQEEASDDEPEQDEEVGSAPTLTPTPTLWLGLHKKISKAELLDGLPPKPVMDRLIALFMSSKEPVCVIIHVGVFQKEYNRFWARRQDVSMSWLGLLYSCLTLAIAIHRHNKEPLPVDLGDATKAAETYRKFTAQCLAQTNYTIPGRYKVETLFLYTMGEFYRCADAQVGISFLLGTIIRLAMRTGYHRDPQQFPDVSPYEGEMRRRLWVILRQLDILISFQVGLPRTVQDWQQDVEPPRNISDSDFDESTQELPPSRPESELTTMSYTLSKARLMNIFGKIADLAYSRGPVTYEDALTIDRQLEEAHDQLPAIFKMRPLDQCIVDPSVLILRRYTLELLYQKSRCVLHRRYLGEVHTNVRYAFSRWVCMTASKEILRHHADLYHESQPGGLLYRDRQYPNSLQTADYLLAAMIISLELSHDPTGAQVTSTDNDVALVIRGREDLLSTLETSHQIFERERESADVQKAYAALSLMLRRVKEAQNEAKEQLAQAQPPPYNSWQMENPYPLGEMPQMDIIPGQPSFDVIEEMLDAPTNLDWRLWDQQIQNGFDGGMGLWNDPGNLPDLNM
ncbi:C6 transcription factor [Aspergillus ellipticus CBS 707.79]|uniref:C6 transcription factor n=1 Tax=Aspergillus ellipticus CBS 707.79 TaxID=1448320 RepID=A0A319DKS4_9EURO|nr:C6 transcription factor [Aspergillus ellipticus CBS 707.79]